MAVSSVPPNAIRGMPKGIHTVDLAHLALIQRILPSAFDVDSLQQ